MASPMVHFLLVYSHTEQELVQQSRFTKIAGATHAYKAAEEKYRELPGNHEVVLVGADSINTVMRTHGHYFMNDSLFDELLAASTR